MTDARSYEEVDSLPPVDLSDETIEKFKEVDSKFTAEEEGREYKTVEEIRSEDIVNEDGTIGDFKTELDKELEAEEAEKAEEQPEEVEEAEAEEAGEEDLTPEEPTEQTLPNRLVQAGLRSGLTEDDIKALGDTAETVLGKMADAQDALTTKYADLGRSLKEQAAPEPPPKFAFKKKALDLGLEEQEEDTRFKQAEDGMNAILGRMNVLEQAERNREQQYIDDTTNRFFDERVKEYPELGETKNMTPAEFELRKQIYNTADNIRLGGKYKGEPISLERGLEQAFSIYESKNVKEHVRSTLVEKTKERSKKRTMRPTQRKTKEKFDSPYKKAEDTVRKWHEARGLRVPDEDEDVI